MRQHVIVLGGLLLCLGLLLAPKQGCEPIHLFPIAPATDLLWLHDADDSSPDAALLRDSPEWRKIAEELKISFLVMDIKEAERQSPNTARRAREIGLPAIAFRDREQQVTVERAPKDLPGVITAIKHHGGGL